MHWLAFWLYAALAAAALAAGVATARAWIPALAGFALGSGLGGWWLGIGAASVVIGLALAAVLWRRVPPWQRSALAGMAAGLAAAVMSAQGMAWPAAALLALAVPMTAGAYATRHPGFAPAALIDQALCTLLVAAPAIAAWTEVTRGWQAALNLNRAAPTTAHSPIPSWTLATLAIAALAGVARQQWTRR